MTQFQDTYSSDYYLSDETGTRHSSDFLLNESYDNPVTTTSIYNQSNPYAELSPHPYEFPGRSIFSGSNSASSGSRLAYQNTIKREIRQVDKPQQTLKHENKLSADAKIAEPPMTVIVPQLKKNGSVISLNASLKHKNSIRKRNKTVHRSEIKGLLHNVESKPTTDSGSSQRYRYNGSRFIFPVNRKTSFRRKPQVLTKANFSTRAELDNFLDGFPEHVLNFLPSKVAVYDVVNKAAIEPRLRRTTYHSSYDSKSGDLVFTNPNIQYEIQVGPKKKFSIRRKKSKKLSKLEALRISDPVPHSSTKTKVGGMVTRDLNQNVSDYDKYRNFIFSKRTSVLIPPETYFGKVGSSESLPDMSTKLAWEVLIRRILALKIMYRLKSQDASSITPWGVQPDPDLSRTGTSSFSSSILSRSLNPDMAKKEIRGEQEDQGGSDHQSELDTIEGNQQEMGSLLDSQVLSSVQSNSYSKYLMKERTPGKDTSSSTSDYSSSVAPLIPSRRKFPTRHSLDLSSEFSAPVGNKESRRSSIGTLSHSSDSSFHSTILGSPQTLMTPTESPITVRKRAYQPDMSTELSSSVSVMNQSSSTNPDWYQALDDLASELSTVINEVPSTHPVKVKTIKEVKVSHGKVGNNEIHSMVGSISMVGTSVAGTSVVGANVSVDSKRPKRHGQALHSRKNSSMGDHELHSLVSSNESELSWKYKKFELFSKPIMELSHSSTIKSQQSQLSFMSNESQTKFNVKERPNMPRPIGKNIVTRDLLGAGTPVRGL